MKLVREQERKQAEALERGGEQRGERERAEDFDLLFYNAQVWQMLPRRATASVFSFYLRLEVGAHERPKPKSGRAQSFESQFQGSLHFRGNQRETGKERTYRHTMCTWTDSGAGQTTWLGSRFNCASVCPSLSPLLSSYLTPSPSVIPSLCLSVCPSVCISQFH